MGLKCNGILNIQLPNLSIGPVSNRSMVEHVHGKRRAPFLLQLPENTFRCIELKWISRFRHIRLHIRVTLLRVVPDIFFGSAVDI